MTLLFLLFIPVSCVFKKHLIYNVEELHLMRHKSVSQNLSQVGKDYEIRLSLFIKLEQHFDYFLGLRHCCLDIKNNLAMLLSLLLQNFGRPILTTHCKEMFMLLLIMTINVSCHIQNYLITNINISCRTQNYLTLSPILSSLSSILFSSFPCSLRGYSPDRPGTFYVAHIDLQLVAILLPLPAECQDYRHDWIMPGYHFPLNVRMNELQYNRLVMNNFDEI